MRFKFKVLIALLILLLPIISFSATINYSEPFELNNSVVQAFGKTFTIDIHPNASINNAFKTDTAYEGTLIGVVNSFVRLVNQNGVWRGLISDGQDVYGVESFDHVHTVIFKLTDVQAPYGSFTSDTIQVNKNVGQILEKQFTGSFTNPSAASMKVSVSIVTDRYLLSRFGSMDVVEKELIVRLNNVDGIFSSQIGVHLDVTLLDINDETSDPFTMQNKDAYSLLVELLQFRNKNSAHSHHDITALVTGRTLLNGTLGMSYKGTLCQTSSVALAQATLESWVDSIILAHELGHVFGADHDGDSSGHCGSTDSSSYIMAPFLSFSHQFSACSINTIQTAIANKSCVIPNEIQQGTSAPFVDTSTPPTHSNGGGGSSDFLLLVTLVGFLTVTPKRK